MKTRVEGFASGRSARWSLFGIAFVESSCFPIPPDPLLIAMSVADPGKSLRFASITTAGSILGAFLGYAIGFALFEAIGRPILEFTGLVEPFHEVLLSYGGNALLVLLLAGFTPIPFALFTIAAGFNQTVPLGTLALGCLIGRSVRFLLVGGLLYMFGEPVRIFLDRHLERVTIAVTVVSVLAFLGLKFLG